jgi:hypothetical protein
MRGSRSQHRLAAIVLGLLLLLPSAAGARGSRARGPVPGERNVLAGLWDLVVSYVFPSTVEKNRGQMDPDGLTAVDPGGEHRGQIDPDGLTATDPDGEHRGQMDPNG